MSTDSRPIPPTLHPASPTQFPPESTPSPASTPSPTSTPSPASAPSLAPPPASPVSLTSP